MNESLEIELRGPLRQSEEKIILGLKGVKEIAINEQLVIFLRNQPFNFRIKYNKSDKYFEFIKKDKVDGLQTTHDEVGFKISNTDAKGFVEIIACLGIKEGFFSFVERHDVFLEDIIWSIKKGSMIGAYWEAEATPELMTKLKNKKKIIEYLSKAISDLGLIVWSEEKFKKIKDSSWKKNKPKPLSLLWKKYTN